MPPDSGGSPGTAAVASSCRLVRSASSGSPPVGASRGTVPSHTASPSRTVSADGAPAPMNDHRDQDRPFSADSSRKVPGRLSASLRYADSGVSASASTLRVTGTTRCSAASARKCSRDVVAAARLACTQPSSQMQIDPDRHWRSVTAMKTGDTVPDFELPDQTGAPRKLSALLSDGPVVLFFYPAAMTY